MATNPLTAFLDSFAGARNQGSRQALTEFQLAQDAQQWRAGQETRDAQLEQTRAVTEGLQLKNQAARKEAAMEDIGAFEMAVDRLGSYRAAFDDPAAQKRLLRGINSMAGPDQPQIVGFSRMTRDNAENWGATPDVYDQIMQQQNPTAEQDDDQLLVPLYKQRDGSARPMDVDGDGQLEMWSGKSGLQFLRSQFTPSEDTAAALGTLYSGQPGGTAQEGVQRQNAPAPSLENYRSAFGEDGARVAAQFPTAEGESDETVIGVPKSALGDKATRAARRVAEGKGISPAQAKDIADNPDQVPTPSARAGAAAGTSFLGDVEESGDGFTVRGGGRPTHKQLTTATILYRSGLLEKNDLTRYADTGQISADGVALVQNGMNNATNLLANKANNERALSQTAMQQAGQTEREQIAQMNSNRRKAAEIAEDRRQFEIKNGKDSKRTPEETLENTTLLSKAQLKSENPNIDDETADTVAANVASKVVTAQTQMPSLRGTDWDDGKWSKAVTDLDKVDRAYNSRDDTFIVGLGTKANRALRGMPQELNLSSNPMAIYLAGEGSQLFSYDNGTFSYDKAPEFITTITEPMTAAAREAGASSLIEQSPENQRRIYDSATRLLRDAARDDPSLLSDPDAIRQAVSAATRASIARMRQASQ